MSPREEGIRAALVAIREERAAVLARGLGASQAEKGITSARAPQPRMNDDALWLWGRARDFEREGFADKDAAALLADMTDTMRADMRRIVPVMAAFFEQLQGAIALRPTALETD